MTETSVVRGEGGPIRYVDVIHLETNVEHHKVLLNMPHCRLSDDSLFLLDMMACQPCYSCAMSIRSYGLERKFHLALLMALMRLYLNLYEPALFPSVGPQSVSDFLVDARLLVKEHLHGVGGNICSTHLLMKLVTTMAFSFRSLLSP